MQTEYNYGTIGRLAETVVKSAMQTATAPVYVGTAPVNLVRGYKESGAINVPAKVSNMSDAQRKLGFSSNWVGFTLCEVMAAHFDNPLGNIGPVYMINVLDPDIHKKSADTTRSLNFSGGRSEFKSDTIILDTLKLAEKMEGVDFRIDYNFAKSTVIITSVDSSAPLTGTVVASFREVDPDAVEADDIIGMSSPGSGEYSGLGAINLIFPELNIVANLLGAPGWSEIPEVYEAMMATAKKINGHWDAFVVADLPLVDGSSKIETIAQAEAWKKRNAYTQENSKVCWPQVIDKAGRIFHLSTFVIVEFMRIDSTHSSVPMETCGNKQIPVIRQYFGAGSTNKGFDQQTANQLTQKGITSAVAWAGRWVLWGDHTAAYSFGSDMDPRAIFDVSMRMLSHITNSFQREHAATIDKPMTRALKDSILNREQEKLDTLVSMGALVGDPRVLFLESENSTEAMMTGDFRWDIPTTPTPPIKSAAVYVAYTTEGFASFFDKEDN